MLDGFAELGLMEVWTPVALSREVGKRPLSLRVASERVVLFRNAEGQVAALLDQCPHRGAALSLGKVGPDGCLECPFHGWRFGPDGACAHVPLNALPPEKRRRLGATAFPVRERGGLIWMYTRPGATAPVEPVVPAPLEDPGFRRWSHVEVFRTHWTRAMENMLDSPHLPYVHRRSIGRGIRRRMTPDSRMNISVHPTPTGWLSTASLDGADGGGVLEWTRPNGMVLHIPMGQRRQVALHVWCVPEEKHTTRLFLVSARNFMRHNPLGRLFDRFNRVVLLEDKRVVESHQPAEVPPPAEERSVATDRATLAFRRWYLEQLGKGSDSGPSLEAPPTGFISAS